MPRDGAVVLKSLDVSLQVLEALDNGAPERGVSDLAREVGASKAAVYRILTTLVAATSPRTRLQPSTPSGRGYVASATSLRENSISSPSPGPT